MKRVILFLCVLVMGAMLWAQVPQTFSYQAVVRNAAGQVLAEQTVGVRLSLRQGSANGTEVYAELHTVTTNVAGLITLVVGEGAVQTQTTLADIDWANGPWYLCTEVDPAGGTNYVLNTVQQLHAVPYALHATDAVAQLQVATLATRVDSLQEANTDALAALNAANDSLKATNDSLKAANAALQAAVSALGTRMQQYVDSAIAAALQNIGSTDTNSGTVTPTPTPDPTPTEVEWVDLGLPSGLLWATCNLGATSPEEYGDHYAWGETTIKSMYDWSTYQYANGDEDQLTKYCNMSDYGYNGFTDNLTTLLQEDDAASQVLGSGARIPTKEEWQELIDNTTVEWTTMNGVNGRLFTAANGNSIFLPAAGWGISDTLLYAGSHGLYLSASLYGGSPYGAWYFLFDSGSQSMTVNSRFDGKSVRAVRASTITEEPTDEPIDNPGEDPTPDPEPEPDDTPDGYVDLGLPSGLLWATCNLGATSPEEYGDYYAWGETTTKSMYDWSTYQYANGGGYQLTKYCNDVYYGYDGFTDNLTTLLQEDDAATQVLGSGARIPTKEEWQELIDNTTVEWTTVNGVNGRLFTATNGNTLFLPAAGYRLGDTLSHAGSYGHYWSASLREGGQDSAWLFDFGSGYQGVGGHNRHCGLSVRAVR